MNIPIMNGTYKRWAAIAGIAAIIGVSIYLYFAYLSPEAAFLGSGGNPFWTGIKNDSSEMVIIKQGETRTIPVELHFWKRLNTLLGIEFEEPEAEHGGLYNPPDGLEILFNLDRAYVQVANEKVVQILDHKDLKLEPSQIEYRFEGVDMVVAEEIGNITISVSNDIPVGDYYFGIATTDAGVNSPYGGNSQLLWIKVVAGVPNDTNTTAIAMENAIRIAEGLEETKDFKKQFEHMNITRQAFYTTDDRAQFTLRWLDQSGLPKDRPVIGVVYAVKTDVENSAFLGVFVDPQTNEVYYTDIAATPFG